jgi:hypothetical protein
MPKLSKKAGTNAMGKEDASDRAPQNLSKDSSAGDSGSGPAGDSGSGSAFDSGGGSTGTSDFGDGSSNMPSPDLVLVRLAFPVLCLVLLASLDKVRFSWHF